MKSRTLTRSKWLWSNAHGNALHTYEMKEYNAEYYEKYRRFTDEKWIIFALIESAIAKSIKDQHKVFLDCGNRKRIYRTMMWWDQQFANALIKFVIR